MLGQCALPRNTTPETLGTCGRLCPNRAQGQTRAPVLPVTHAVTWSSVSSMVRTVVGWKELYQRETSLSLDISYLAKVSSLAQPR